MRLLILGGTEFVGRAFVEEALARGDEVTVLNRGTHPAPEGVTALRGDRREPGGLAAAGRGEWDVVVDTWSWEPAAVRDAASALAGRAERYVYVSSRSVYEFPTPPGAGEDAPLVEATGADAYPQYKIGGELGATAAFGERALLVRAGLVIGPYENVGRLPWWLRRIAAGGPVLAPGPPDLGLQYVDARDLAGWSLEAAAKGLGGAYNMISPPGFTTMRELLETCVEVTGSDAELRWVEPERILAAGVEPWTDLPIWIPPGEMHGTLHQAGVSKVLEAGLECRPVAATVADTWAWLREVGEPPRRPDRPAVGLDPQVEASLI
ncbi:NAD-dependent epimerase/dehydratase family protein [Actinomadura sp. 21ATH]|uniref:NAD-dependent epimerase/dehydratase family protein n=1 Tax=Actinomadura sp. 21ATH TaxID=1735444 RepID=UPI0035C25D7B